jgi:CRP-like cAMP-binding protein
MSSQPSHLLPGNWSPDLLRALRDIESVRRFPKGATLFQRGSAVTGVYLVETGEVRILLPNTHREKQLLEVAGPGIMLGLSESMTGERYRITAEAAESTTAMFIPREEFLAFLREHADFCMQVVQRLGEDLHALYHKFRGISAHPGRPRHRLLDRELE